MKHILMIGIVFIALGLTACGFRPLYSEPSDTAYGQQSAATALSDVKIGNIPDREGQYLRNALIDRFYQHGYPQDARYELDVSPIKETRTDLDITKTADTTRSQLKLTTTIVLYDRYNSETVLKRRLMAITSYNTLQSQYTTRVSEENTRKNALDDLARQIEQQLALYFKRENNPL